MTATVEPPTAARPILLFDDECGVCRRIARWVDRSARTKSGESTIDVRPIGSDPAALSALDPTLDIWAAYATIHLLMPDGRMKLGGEAVAEVFRRLPATSWFAWTFGVGAFGFRPFQSILNAGYAVLAAVRPVFGCESCGLPNRWLRPIAALVTWGRGRLGRARPARPTPHFTGLNPRGAA
jgi:predicted DCC family thiol-disulfide oxidoreductase YuxK